jgi:hypothetical protein
VLDGYWIAYLHVIEPRIKGVTPLKAVCWRERFR